MKHFIIPFCIAVSLLVGCGAQTTPDNTTTTTNTTNTTTDNEENTEDTQWKETLHNSIQSLSSRVSDTMARVNNVENPSGTDEEKRTQYLELKKEIETVDQEVENVEEVLEKGLRESKLTQDEYQKADRELESLEDLLDAAEDKLEVAFGIVD